MRTLIDVGEAEIAALARLAAKGNVSRAALIRKAIKGFLDTNRDMEEQQAFGLWAEHPVDGLAYQEKLRDEW